MKRRITRSAVRSCLGLILLGSQAAAGALPAQQIGAFERSRGRYMLQTAVKHLEKYYFDTTYGGVDLKAGAARADSAIEAAESNSQIFTAIAEFMQLLQDSHTTFIPPRRAADIEYGWRLQMIGDACYVVEVEPGSDAAVQGLRVGDRVLAVDRYLPTRQYFSLLDYFLHDLSPRPIVRLTVAGPDQESRTLEIRTRFTPRPRVRDLGMMIREYQLGDRKAEDVGWLGDEVAILRLGWFGSKGDIDRAMSRVRKAEVLVLDLRGNGGGWEEGLVRLVGHMFDRPTVVVVVQGRDGAETIEGKPVRQGFRGRLYVLIDSNSASSAEVFARLVQLHGRGLVLGDRSAGLVRRARFFPLSVGQGRETIYGLSITIADGIMSDGTGLEGTGVEPDALVLPGPADLAAGRDPALSVALGMAGYPTDPQRAGTLLPKPNRR